MGEDGATLRAHLEAAAPRSVSARAALDGPECPECLEYLRDWAYELHGRSGVGMDGAAPLNPVVVEAWARLYRLDIEPHEYEALVSIDAAMRHPGEAEPDEQAPTVAPAWPAKKG